MLLLQIRSLILLTLLAGSTATFVNAGTWTLTEAMNIPRFQQTSTLLPNGLVLAVGGEAQNGGGFYTSSAELYDPTAGTWSITGSTHIPRISHTATLLNTGQVLAAGGQYNIGGPVGLNSSELFNPKTGVWSMAGKLNYGRFGAAAVLLTSGQVLVAGGFPQCSMTACFATNTAELYDSATGMWTGTGAMIHRREGHALVALNDGRALAIGGTANGPNGALLGAEIFDPATGTWTETAPMFVNRVGMAAIRLQNGTVLVAGGLTGFSLGPQTAAAELFDPTTGGWTLTGTMGQARGTAIGILFPVLEPNGRVVLAGGDTTGLSTETYEPVSGKWTSDEMALVPTGQVTESDGAISRLALGRILSSGIGPQIYDPKP